MLPQGASIDVALASGAPKGRELLTGKRLAVPAKIVKRTSLPVLRRCGREVEAGEGPFPD
jgi:hypothetical protein